jgi:hypothetical protein
MISFCGIYLKYFCKDDEIIAGHAALPTSDEEVDGMTTDNNENPGKHVINHPHNGPAEKINPLRLAFSKQNRMSLLASAMVPMIWSGG